MKNKIMNYIHYVTAGIYKIVKKYLSLTKMPIKYTEDYVTFPIFSSEPTTSESDSAKIHGWQWYNGKK